MFESPSFKSLIKVMEELFNSKDGSDVTFVVHGKEIQAHKWILTARSPVFKAMIEGPMAPENQVHNIGDPKVMFDDFENFLRFLYTDQLVGEKRFHKSLIHLGAFYDVPYLLEKCAEDIREYLHAPGLILEYAELALRYAPATSKLLQICLDNFCQFDFDAPLSYKLEDSTVKWISADLVLEIVKKCNRHGRFEEDALFVNVFKWAENEAMRQSEEQPTPEEIKAVMTPLMPHFTVTNLSPTILATTIKPYKLIPIEELLDYFLDFVIHDRMPNRERRGGERGFDIRFERRGGRAYDDFYNDEDNYRPPPPPRRGGYYGGYRGNFRNDDRN